MKTAQEPTGMSFANEANLIAIDSMTEFFINTFSTLNPGVQVVPLTGNAQFVCGRENPTFELQFCHRTTGRSVYLHMFTQGKLGNACERSHRYLSLRQDLRAALLPGDEISLLFVPYTREIPLRYHEQLVRASKLCGAHPTLGYNCSNERNVLATIALEISNYLGGSTSQIISIS